ncbi:hypothetical protein GCM10025866_18530 [Naasia aerilata]|uniref:Uncharacterized protein n=1 Tax=Naasia aerilata TaxID=1162966 RepID=A0ABN6XLX8_9MICO|nr:hypothetical protein GCM10025866_18530 [Naasia aerilata]
MGVAAVEEADDADLGLPDRIAVDEADLTQLVERDDRELGRLVRQAGGSERRGRALRSVGGAECHEPRLGSHEDADARRGGDRQRRGQTDDRNRPLLRMPRTTKEPHPITPNFEPARAWQSIPSSEPAQVAWWLGTD